MGDSYYPTVETDFIINHILNSSKVLPESRFTIGSTTTFIVKGDKPIHKLKVLIREVDKGEVNFEQASALAWQFQFMGALLKWLENNKNWKEGGYIDPNYV